MKKALLLSLLFAGLALLVRAERLVITVSNPMSDVARPGEVVTLPWSEVSKALPGALLQRIAVKNPAGVSVAYQVTNVAPLAKDPKNVGIAYGELIFQHDFAAGEKEAVFTVEKIDMVAPVFPARVFARYVPERLDDFAWENDRVAHRTYGPALGAPDDAKTGKEVLVTSGLDIWAKRVSYPVVDRWYNKGHDHYHHDEGEGMDMYNVGKSRGLGGVGIWDGTTLFTGRNYKSWKVLANGPIRAIFELTYEAWDAGAGVKVSEVKRFTVDAGRQFDQMDSTFTIEGATEVVAAVGLNKNPADKGQEPKVETFKADQALAQWVAQKSNEEFGSAIILPSATGYAEDPLNQLILAKATAGQPLRYYLGFAWTRAGHVTSKADWLAQIDAFSKRVAAPVVVSKIEAK